MSTQWPSHTTRSTHIYAHSGWEHLGELVSRGHDCSSTVATELTRAMSASRRIITISPPEPISTAAHLMVNVFGTERVTDELPFILDNVQGFLWHQPEVAPLGADAALAVAHGLDLGGVDLKDKGTTVAVAAVRLGRLLGVGHVVAEDEGSGEIELSITGIRPDE
jgi:hypothetical protein